MHIISPDYNWTLYIINSEEKAETGQKVPVVPVQSFRFTSFTHLLLGVRDVVR